jgi:hypothetical protein
MGKVIKLTESQLRHVIKEAVNDIAEGPGPLSMVGGLVRKGINKLMGTVDNVPLVKATASANQIATSKLFSKSATRIATHLDNLPITPAIKSLFKNAESEVFVCIKDLSRAVTDVQVLKNNSITAELNSIISNTKDLYVMLPSISTFPRPRFKNIISEIDYIEGRLIKLMINVPNNVNLKNAHQNLKDTIHVIEDALGQAITLR